MPTPRPGGSHVLCAQSDHHRFPHRRDGGDRVDRVVRHAERLVRESAQAVLPAAPRRVPDRLDRAVCRHRPDGGGRSDVALDRRRCPGSDVGRPGWRALTPEPEPRPWLPPGTGRQSCAQRGVDLGVLQGPTTPGVGPWWPPHSPPAAWISPAEPAGCARVTVLPSFPMPHGACSPWHCPDRSTTSTPGGDVRPGEVSRPWSAPSGTARRRPSSCRRPPGRPSAASSRRSAVPR